LPPQRHDRSPRRHGRSESARPDFVDGLLGVYHGLREEHLQAYPDESVFRFNRRRTPQAAFSRPLGLAVTTGPHPYDALIASGSKG
jgi:hypothetical protein